MTGAPSARTEVHRLPERAAYDRKVIDAILDEALICHVGFVRDGSPVVIPTIHARVGDTLYLHGSPVSGLARALKTGIEVSVNVTIIDGLVLARSSFHSSMNYRSVVVFGTASLVTDLDEKRRVLDALVDHIAPGRPADTRRTTDKELRATAVLGVPLGEASAKIRTGGPVDDEEDYALPIWAGVVPMSLVAGEPVADDRVLEGVEAPGYLTGYAR